MLNIELYELEIFAALVKYGSFSKASDELSIATSGVSRTIKKLETKLNVKIFNRTTRKMNLTQEGEWLWEQAVDIINQAHSVERHLSKANEIPQGIIRVDAATPFTLHAIAPVIPGFKKKFSQIKIILTSSESIVDLIERNVDVAIRIGELSDSTLRARKLGDCHRMVYASPGYLEKSAPILEVSDLTQHVCLGFMNPEKLNTWPLYDSEGEWLKVHPEVIADSGETLKQLAIEGCGVTCLSSFAAEQDVRDGKLVCVLEHATERVLIPVYAVFYSDNEMNIRLRSFLDYLVEHVFLGSVK